MQSGYKSLSQEIKKTIVLALPICTGQLGNVLTSVADYTMLGHANPVEMAGATFATSVFFPFMIFGLGFGLGLTPLVANARGAKDFEKQKNLFVTSFKVNFLIGVLILCLLFWIGRHFNLFNQPDNVIDVCRKYFVLISLSIIPIMLFSTLKQYLEGLQNTLTPMIISLIGNVLNIILNYLLIFDHGGYGGLGIEGAGWATLFSRTFMFLTFFGYYLYFKKLRSVLISAFKNMTNFTLLKEITNISLPISVFMFFEVTAFSVATFIMGWVSEAHIAAHQAALSLASISFVIAMGVGNAGSIRSATYLGEGNLRKIGGVAKSVVTISLVLSTLFASIFLFFNDYLPLFFVDSDEKRIITLTSVLLLYAALFQFSDGLQVVFQGLLQGIGDVKIPSIIAAAAYWLIGLPLGYILTFYTNTGYTGVWIGLSVGLTFSAILQIARYKFSLRKLMS